MDDPGWWRGAVLYQVYPRSFADADGDGVGDLPGLLARLDHVASLGVDALWLGPVYPSPGRDFGYDVTDHRAVDPLFGTLDDLDRLVAGAHARGLRVLLDLVAGHTSDRHPWFLASRGDRGGPQGDWYVWADPRPDGGPPNNWLSVFGGPAWRWDPRRRQYGLHHFLPEQPALNLHVPAVRAALLDTARFWLARGVDGFRIDAVDFLAHDPGLADNPAAARPAGAPVPAKLFGMQAHRHDMMHPAGGGFLAELRQVLETHPGTVALGEFSSQPGAYARIAAATAGAAGLHLGYALAPLRGGFDRDVAGALLAASIEVAGQGGALCQCFSNHDVERVATRWAGEDPRRVAQCLALLLTLPGAVCLYQGEELGLPEAVLEEAALRDPFGIAFWPEFRGRDGCRTPLPWDGAAPQAGFSAGVPWLPIPAAHRARSVAAQETDASSTLHLCRALLRRRRATPAWRWGGAGPLDVPAPLFGFFRAHGGEREDLVFNLSAGHAVVPGGAGVLPPWGFAELAADGLRPLA